MIQSLRDRLQVVQSKLSFEDWKDNPQFAQTKVSQVSKNRITMHIFAILNLFHFRLLFHIRNPQLIYIPFSRY
jgi:hypothetical protein